MAITFTYDPPAEGTSQVDVTFYLDGEVHHQCLVNIVFHPGLFDAELTEQRVRTYADMLEVRRQEGWPAALGEAQDG